MIVRPICTKIFAKNPFRFCRVSTTLWEAFRWTSGTALRCGICTLPVNAALSTMAQTVWVEILFWVRSMEDRLLRKLPAGKQSVPPNMPCAEESLLPELSPDAQMQMNRILLNALGVVRDAQTLEAGIQEIRKLSGTLPLLGCAMLESALARKESRGAHWRADYPQRNDAVYCKTTVAHWNGQHIAISFESIPERRHDL